MARSSASVTKIDPSRWLTRTVPLAISIERRTNSGPLALIQLIRTIESSWKQSRICSHNPWSRLKRSRSTNWETAETSAASRTALGRDPVICHRQSVRQIRWHPRVLRKESVTSPLGTVAVSGGADQCPKLMLWTAPPPARECHGCGRC